MKGKGKMETAEEQQADKWLFPPQLKRTKHDFLLLLDTMAGEHRSVPLMIMGDTGVGKSAFVDRFKRHFLQRKPGKQVRRVNVAAIPETLVESTLFGHLKGSFTGAIQNRKGLVESADLLILEEIGELSQPVQAKLLTFIEDGIYYQIGADEPKPARHIQILATTNRTEKGFRPDFYHRFFHFEIPPLYRRRMDVLHYFRHFSPSAYQELRPWEIMTLLTGGEMKRPTFIGEDEVFIRALISHAYQKREISEDEFFSNRSIVKNHIDSGAALLGQMFQECGRDADKLLENLVNEVEFGGRREAAGHGLDIFIGRTLLQRTELIVELNNTARHANSHLAIMGKPGTGKTQFILKILADIRVQSNFQTNFIYFDYKGDVVDNERFIDVAKVHPFRLLQSGQSLPINPFILPDYDEQTVNVSAREKAESFASINSKLGVVQKGALTEAIRAAYAQRVGSALPYPDFHDVYRVVISMYEEDHKKDDSLIEVLRDLADFDLFWRHGSDISPIERLVSRMILIDVHAMPVLKELVAYLVIERLYKEMTLLPDSPVKDGRRTIRTILVIDEAHNYLNQKNIFLQRIIREGRSKGVVVFFASQSPNDYQQKFFNFQELLEFAFIFQCEGVSPSSVQDILGCSLKTAKDLQTEISRLEPGQVIARSAEKTAEFVKFTAEAFYKSYA